MSVEYNVLFAVYGALAGGNENQSEAAIVTQPLQEQLNNGANGGVVTINNTTMDVDPAPGSQKHFGAIVQVNNGTPQPFACVEGQTINFS